MCKILLSIKPNHVENIFNGTKIYEFRKTKCKKEIDKIIIYSTSPIMRVVGEAKVKRTLEGPPEIIWAETKEKAGIDERFFLQYFEGKKKAIAYKLEEVIRYEEPKELGFFGLKCAPQSFVYL